MICFQKQNNFVTQISFSFGMKKFIWEISSGSKRIGVCFTVPSRTQDCKGEQTLSAGISVTLGAFQNTSCLCSPEPQQSNTTALTCCSEIPKPFYHPWDWDTWVLQSNKFNRSKWSRLNDISPRVFSFGDKPLKIIDLKSLCVKGGAEHLNAI